MISLFAIIVSCAMVMYVVLRAVKMDRMRPWFETRSIYEQEQKREKAAQEGTKNKINLGRRTEGFATPGTRRTPSR